jgi:hypothetical protein
MTFTVVRAVRAAEATTLEAREKLQGTVAHAMPARPLAMDLPYAEHVIRLNFVSDDFARTIPGGLS